MELLLALLASDLRQLVVRGGDGGHADGAVLHALEVLVDVVLPLENAIQHRAVLNHAN